MFSCQVQNDKSMTNIKWVCKSFKKFSKSKCVDVATYYKPHLRGVSP